jgi:hypothetical protein
MFSHIKELFTRPSGYNIARSVRTRASASGSFNRTFTTGDTKTWTWSGWVKRGAISASNQWLFATTASQSYIAFNSTENLLVAFYSTNSATGYTLTTSQVFRDPSAWYHVVLAVDTTQATNTNRIKLYVNGTQITAFSAATYPAQNDVGQINTAVVHRIASYDGSLFFFDGYLTEINFVNAQQLTPSSFGETDSITGVWKAKKYGGTYGTNGFYLNFSDNSNNTAATIGKDYSGNGNNWTPNNISVTAGVTYDSMVDSPTTSAVSSNYCVLNPLTLAGSGYTLSNGNLDISSTAVASVYSTVAVNTGKYYAEFTLTTAPSSAYAYVGVRSVTGGLYVYRSSDGQYYDNSTYSSYGASYTTNDVIGVAVDGVNGTITFYKNGASQGQKTGLTIVGDTAYYITPSTTAATGAFSANFGQRPFSSTPPTGFVALNTYNLPASTIKNGAAYMAATTYTGNGGTQSISNAVNGVSFQPDLVWIKGRSYVSSNWLTDSIRGVNNILSSNQTAAEVTLSSTMTAFNSNGFSVGSNADFNSNTNTLIGWQWKAGTTSASNTNGSITSTVSVGATQGFSVVTYTGTGANATVGHGLGVAPSMMLFKNRTSAVEWQVYHASIGNGQYGVLNSTAAFASSGIWQNTTPTSSVFSIGNFSGVNTSTANYVAYCFSAVAGYSAFGSYTGNGSTDGPFVFTNMRPRFVMVKRTDAVGDWYVFDTGRDPYNATTNGLIPNSSGTDTSYTGWGDLLSNGFKIRRTDGAWNASGGTYIYAAFSEVGFKSALAR